MSLETDFQFFRDNQESLVKEHLGKYLVIKDSNVVGAYNSAAEAYQEASSKFEPGSFLIQLCIPGEEAYTQIFHSRVVFA